MARTFSLRRKASSPSAAEVGGPSAERLSQAMGRFGGIAINAVDDRFESLDQSVPNQALPGSDFAAELLAETSGGRPLDRDARAFFAPRFGRSFDAIRIHTESRAARLSREVNARAFTHRNHVFFGPNQYDFKSDQGRRLIAHELTHTLQYAGFPDQSRLQRASLADVDAGIKKKLRISRTPPPSDDLKAWVKKYFDPKEGTSATTSIPIELGASITDKQVQKGFMSLAAELVSQSRSSVNPDPESRPLDSNSILDLEIDASAFKGEHAIYRFTRYTDKKAEKIIVEKVRSAGAGGQAPSTASLTGDVKVGGVDVHISSDFSEDDAKAIHTALLTLPDPIRAQAKDLTFERSSSAKGPDGENGRYDPLTDQVTLYRNLFDATARRIGSASSATYQIVHEIGHALDLRPEFAAEREVEKLKKEKGELEKQSRKIDFSGDPLGTQEDPKKKEQEKKIAELEKKIKDLSKNLGQGKSISGNELGKNSEALTTDFGKALAQDGITAVNDAIKRNKEVEAHNKAHPDQPRSAEPTLSGGVSLYADTDLMEAFAENFSYYVLDPDLLKSIRPATYAFFEKKFPKTVAAPNAPGGKP